MEEDRLNANPLDVGEELRELKAKLRQQESQLAEIRGIVMPVESGGGIKAAAGEDGPYFAYPVGETGDGCFLVRYCKGLEGRAAGQWEIYLPPGCCAVGGDCKTLNRLASETGGHDGEDYWYKLNLNESEGGTESRTVAGNTVHSRRWEIVVHAKTSAKRYGVDALDAAPGRYMYVSAEPYHDRTAQMEERRSLDSLGDEFSRIVATVYVDTSGDNPRSVDHTTVNAINVAAAAMGNFQLVWYFSVDASNVLAVDKVYCVANTMSAAGMVLKGDDMVDVSAIKNIGALAEGGSHKVYATIRTNENNLSENIVEVNVDATPTYNDDYTVWLLLYSINWKGQMTDSRATALANVQIYR